MIGIDEWKLQLRVPNGGAVGLERKGLTRWNVDRRCGRMSVRMGETESECERIGGECRRVGADAPESFCLHDMDVTHSFPRHGHDWRCRCIHHDGGSTRSGALGARGEIRAGCL